MRINDEPESVGGPSFDEGRPAVAVGTGGVIAVATSMPRGVVHAAWIDGRFAPRGTHEPAELFHARVDDGEVTEINLTADQQDSICDCCRIDVDVRADDRVGDRLPQHPRGGVEGARAPAVDARPATAY